MATESGVKQDLHPRERRIWEMVALSPAKSLWDLRYVSIKHIVQRTWKSMQEDRLISIGAELGFWFLFALFPALICATTILGLVARSASGIYGNLLEHLAMVVPQEALGMVVRIFNQTTVHSSSGKLTLGLLGAIWSASVAISAAQDTLNAVYKITERRSYIKLKLQAIALTLLVILTGTLSLAALFGGDLGAVWVSGAMGNSTFGVAAGIVVRVAGWIIAAGLLGLTFAEVYYWAPDLRKPQWHWITPGATLGIVGWVLASIGFRIYLHFFNTYTVTYGSLGTLIILLMWFYITGLMLLLGAEFNSELEAAAMEVRLNREKADGKQEPGDQHHIAPAA